LPTAARLGRPRRRHRLTAQGLAMLREARAMHEAMWAALPDALQQKLALT
jgi:hypothetical protein